MRNTKTYNELVQKMRAFFLQKGFIEVPTQSRLSILAACENPHSIVPYCLTDENGEQIGRVARKGWASVWNARYNIYDKEGNQLFYIKERNPWVKVCDAILNSIPIISLFAGYLFNPKYDVKDMQDNKIVMLKKDPSFWGRNFSVSKEGDLKDEHEEKIVLSLMMMILLERRRG